MDKKEKGIYGKFIVKRADGKDAPGEKHARCAYFVLDIDHDPYAIAAIRAYAEACNNDYPKLACDLRCIEGSTMPGTTTYDLMDRNDLDDK
jgi:hypothetical protein